MQIYHIDSSARKSESVSKSLAKLLVEKLKKSGDTITYRDTSSSNFFKISNALPAIHSQVDTQ